VSAVVVVDDQANNVNTAGAGDGEAPLNPGTGPLQGSGPSAPPTSPMRGADIKAQLAQVHELEAKLAEECRAVRLLRASIAGEASARGEHARELSRQARDRINVDFDVNNPNTPRERVSSSQLQHCCEPCLLPRRRGAEPAPRGVGAH
jgi:hypothetical protein